MTQKPKLVDIDMWISKELKFHVESKNAIKNILHRFGFQSNTKDQIVKNLLTKISPKRLTKALKKHPLYTQAWLTEFAPSLDRGNFRVRSRFTY